MFDTQTAKIGEKREMDRWFGDGPVGRLYFANEGFGKTAPAWPVTAEEEAAWRVEGHALIDRRIDAMARHAWLHIGGLFAGMFVLMLVRPSFASMGFGLGGALLWIHLHPFVAVWQLHRELTGLRQRIERALATRAPVMAETAARWRPSNPWRLALYPIAGALIGLALVQDEWIIDQLPPYFWIVLMLAIWGLSVMAERADKHPSPAARASNRA